MDMDTIIELGRVAIPVAATVITGVQTNKLSRRHAAKQSILQMIMEDEFGWEMFRKFPVNYGNICDEYEIYHKNGGNGEVTKKVEEYKAWYKRNEDDMISMIDQDCRPKVVLTCKPKK